MAMLVITRSHDPRPGLAGGLRPAVAHASDQLGCFSYGRPMANGWKPWLSYGKMVIFYMYHLVMTNIAMENHHF